MKLIGILLILNSIAVSSYWITTHGTHKGAVLTLCFLAVFAGFALVLSDRITELSVKGVGTIRAAAEQASSDAKAISDIKTRIEAQSATVDLVADRAKSTVKSLQELSKIFTTTELGLIKRSGRLGGYSYEEKEEIKIKTIELLKKAGITEDEISIIEEECKWHLYTTFDYVHLILGGSTIPQKIFQHKDRIKERKTLLDIKDLPSPDKLRAFLDKCGVLIKAEEFIKDYEYYIDNHKQRRLDTWNKRDEWRKIIWE